MASSKNGTVLFVSLMILLLISTGVKAYCERVRSRSAPHDICKKKNGNAVCKEKCWTIEKYQNGRCLILPKTTKLDCYCYHFDQC
ncbi:Defensin-like (DEFL) family protein [Arabidopsis thaliana]|uniref:Putative defensin-like protein 38 n=1 Tax=Arabidopsis thaliana TaxID=3702 RepID=DEF38_ARATH|nr:Defensin-like (DEFL) family protein [Arabidopsis thaliana]Q2V462.1 RecName: Full=Putative defensin-like protein 38; Flags: Precursor [Arabidopsis thaliana]AEC07602.1 Defensin-like (DEFL) family protein [Arabidopsis thaliana]|eukprot:NP_001031408.1 Defensin-like (DEFL) family protein [Arabidopsis thaliana]